VLVQLLWMRSWVQAWETQAGGGRTAAGASRLRVSRSKSTSSLGLRRGRLVAGLLETNGVLDGWKWAKRDQWLSRHAVSRTRMGKGATFVSMNGKVANKHDLVEP
jgi:hypothetical protein